MAKQLSDGRVDFSDDLCFEEFELMQHWYGGQWCPLYALQSSGTLYREDIGSAVCTLERLLKNMDEEETHTAQGLIYTLNKAAEQFPAPEND